MTKSKHGNASSNANTKEVFGKVLEVRVAEPMIFRKIWISKEKNFCKSVARVGGA